MENGEMEQGLDGLVDINLNEYLLIIFSRN